MVFNKSDKVILLAGLILLVLFGIFPPWAFFDPSTGNFVESCDRSGFMFFDQPEPTARIHFLQLIYNWVVIAVLTITVLLTKKVFSKETKKDVLSGVQSEHKEDEK